MLEKWESWSCYSVLKEEKCVGFRIYETKKMLKVLSLLILVIFWSCYHWKFLWAPRFKDFSFVFTVQHTLFTVNFLWRLLPLRPPTSSYFHLRLLFIISFHFNYFCYSSVITGDLGTILVPLVYLKTSLFFSFLLSSTLGMLLWINLIYFTFFCTYARTIWLFYDCEVERNLLWSSRGRCHRGMKQQQQQQYISTKRGIGTKRN